MGWAAHLPAQTSPASFTRQMPTFLLGPPHIPVTPQQCSRTGKCTVEPKCRGSSVHAGRRQACRCAVQAAPELSSVDNQRRRQDGLTRRRGSRLLRRRAARMLLREAADRWRLHAPGAGRARLASRAVQRTPTLHRPSRSLRELVQVDGYTCNWCTPRSVFRCRNLKLLQPRVGPGCASLQNCLLGGRVPSRAKVGLKRAALPCFAANAEGTCKKLAKQGPRRVSCGYGLAGQRQADGTDTRGARASAASPR